MARFKGKNIFKPFKTKSNLPNFKAKKIYTSSKGTLIERLEHAMYTHIKTPIRLSLINNTTETIRFINRLENLCNQKKSVFVNMGHLEYLDSSGITVLLSVVYLFKERKIKFNGDFPENVYFKEMLKDSGFFESISINKPPKSDYSIGITNQILTEAKKSVDSAIGLPIQQEVSKTIWGEIKALKGLQRILIELLHNTNNHAVLNEKGK